MDTILRLMGEELHKARKERGYTIEKLAMLCDLQRNSISLAERGAGNPTMKTLWKMAAAMGIQLSDIFTLIESKVELPAVKETEQQKVYMELNQYIMDMSYGQRHAILSILKEVHKYSNDPLPQSDDREDHNETGDSYL